METQGIIRAVEEQNVIERYEILKTLGTEMFRDSSVVKTGEVSIPDINKAREFMVRGARETNPPVWSSYWEHIIIAPELGRRIAEQAAAKGLEVDPLRVEFALWLHDASAMVTSAYNRKDYIGDTLLRKMGLPSEILRALSSTHKLMAASQELKPTAGQKRLEAPLDARQEAVVEEYFLSLTPEQRITNLGDNLGKRDGNGLFTLEAFRQYLTTQESRYDQSSPWPSVNWAISSPTPVEVPGRQYGAVLQYYTIKKTIEWLKNSGVNVDGICQDLADYGPKIVVVVRHGEIDNPTGIVYNRDSVMKQDQAIHISDRGKQQMTDVGKILSSRKFNITSIFSSPETRALESIKAIRTGSDSTLPVQIVEELDDAMAPGPYTEGMSMETFMGLAGNVYDENRWGKYHHESPGSITKRTRDAFWKIAKDLRVGQTAVMLSHGDPIAFLLNALDNKKITPAELRNAIYPKKAEATAVIIGPDAKVFTMYSLNRAQLNESKVY